MPDTLDRQIAESLRRLGVHGTDAGAAQAGVPVTGAAQGGDALDAQIEASLQRLYGPAQAIAASLGQDPIGGGSAPEATAPDAMGRFGTVGEGDAHIPPGDFSRSIEQRRAAGIPAGPGGIPGAAAAVPAPPPLSALHPLRQAARMIGAGEAPRDRSVAGELGAGIARGAVRLPGQIAGAVEVGLGALGADVGLHARGGLAGMLQSLQGASEAGAAKIPASPPGENLGLREIAGAVGEGIPQIGLAVLAGAAAGGNPAAGAAAFAVTGALPVVGMTYQQALMQHGSEALARDEAIAMGWVTTLTNTVPGLAIFQRTPAGQAALGLAMRKAVARVGTAAAAEGSQEFIEETAQQIAAMMMRPGEEQSVERMLMESGAWRERITAGIAGAILGGGARGGIETAATIASRGDGAGRARRLDEGIPEGFEPPGTTQAEQPTQGPVPGPQTPSEVGRSADEGVGGVRAERPQTPRMPWEMTREEFVAESMRIDGGVRDEAFHSDVHRGVVERSIAAGRIIPPEVLADYPDLTAQAERGKVETDPGADPEVIASLIVEQSLREFDANTRDLERTGLAEQHPHVQAIRAAERLHVAQQLERAAKDDPEIRSTPTYQKWLERVREAEGYFRSEEEARRLIGAPESEGVSRPKSMTIEEFRASRGLPRQGLGIDHSTLSPSGKVSRTQRQSTEAELRERSRAIEAADAEYALAVREGRIIDPSGQHSRERMIARDVEEAQKAIANAESRIAFLESQPRTKAGQIRGVIQAAIDRQIEQKRKAEERIEELTKEPSHGQEAQAAPAAETVLSEPPVSKRPDPSLMTLPQLRVEAQRLGVYKTGKKTKEALARRVFQAQAREARGEPIIQHDPREPVAEGSAAQAERDAGVRHEPPGSDAAKALTRRVLAERSVELEGGAIIRRARPADFSRAWLDKAIEDAANELGFHDRAEAMQRAVTAEGENVEPSTSFRGSKLPAEIAEALEGHPRRHKLRRMIELNAKRDDGMDWMMQVGGGQAFVDWLDAFVASGSRKPGKYGLIAQRQWLEQHGREYHPTSELLLFLDDAMRQQAGRGRARLHAIEHPEALPPGTTLRIYGTEFVVSEIVDKPGDPESLSTRVLSEVVAIDSDADGIVVQLQWAGTIPADINSIEIGDPAVADEHTGEITIEEVPTPDTKPTDLFGRPSVPITGGQEALIPGAIGRRPAPVEPELTKEERQEKYPGIKDNESIDDYRFRVGEFDTPGMFEGDTPAARPEGPKPDKPKGDDDTPGMFDAPAREPGGIEEAGSRDPFGGEPGRIKVAPTPPDPARPAKTLREIILRLGADVGRRVRTGKTRRGVGGTYFPASARTVIRFSGDLDTTAHEIAHALDDAYGITAEWKESRTSPFDGELIPAFSRHGSVTKTGPRSKPWYKRAEGVAEWLRAWMVNPQAAEKAAPKFAAHVKATVPPEVLARVRAFGDEIRAWAGRTAADRTLSNVEISLRGTAVADRVKGIMAPVRRTARGFATNWVDRLSAQALDSLAPLWKGVDEAMRLRGIEDLLPSQDPKIRIRLYAGFNKKLMEVLDNGPRDTQGRRVEGVGGFDWLIEPLADEGIAGPQARAQIEQRMGNTVALMISERIVERAGQIEKAAEDQIAALGEDPDPVLVEKIRQAAQRKASRLAGTGAGIVGDVEQAKAAIAEIKAQPDYQRIREAARRYRAWANAVLKYAFDSGRITKERYEKILENNTQYVDMHRLIEQIEPTTFRSPARAIGAVGQILHAFKGSTRPILHPYASLIHQTAAIMRESDRNIALRTVRDLLTTDRKLHEGEVLNLDAIGSRARPGDKDTIDIYIDGKPEPWQFEEGIHKALKGAFESHDDGLLLKALQVPGRILRAGVIYSPPFMIRNPIRDAQQRFLVSNVGSTPLDMIEYASPAGAREYRDDKQEFYAFGGGLFGYYGASRADYYGHVRDAVGRVAKERGGVLSLAPRAIGAYKRLSEESELVGRITEFRRAYRVAKSRGMSDEDAGLWAAYQSRDLVDYAVAGSAVRQINRYIPFFNAAVQGTRRVARAMGTPQYWKRMVVLMAAESMLHMLRIALDDDEEWRQQPGYKRDLFWQIKAGPVWLSFPKPWESGIIGSAPARLIDQMMGKPEPWRDFMGGLARSLTPADVGTLAGPMRGIVEVLSNHDFFRDRSIIPPHEERRALAMREGTADASRIGQIIQRAFGVDGRQVDHLILSQAGGLGRMATDAANLGRAEKPGVGEFLARASGLVFGPPAFDARDVQDALRRAQEHGLENEPEIRTLRAMLGEMREAKDAADRDAIAARIREQGVKAKAAIAEMEGINVSPDVRSLLRERTRLMDLRQDLTPEQRTRLGRIEGVERAYLAIRRAMVQARRAGDEARFNRLDETLRSLPARFGGR